MNIVRTTDALIAAEADARVSGAPLPLVGCDHSEVDERAQVLARDGNMAIVQLEGRAFPGICVQGDAFAELQRQLMDAAGRCSAPVVTMRRWPTSRGGQRDGPRAAVVRSSPGRAWDRAPVCARRCRLTSLRRVWAENCRVDVPELLGRAVAISDHSSTGERLDGRRTRRRRARAAPCSPRQGHRAVAARGVVVVI